MIEDYTIKKSKRRHKSIEMKVVNNEIVIYSPQRIANKKIEEYYQKYKNVLLNKINPDKNKKYIDHLGKKYQIKIEESELLKNPVAKIENDFFIIFKPKKKDISVQNVIEKWQTNEAKKIVVERVNLFIKNYKFNFSFEKNNIKFKNQKTRWGSCSFSNNLNFNFKIVEKPIEIIDYLVVHELSHTLYKNHSMDFWNYVGSIVKNYKELRNMLKK